VVHGGAGDRAPDGPGEDLARAGCAAAARAGFAILRAGGSALDAVEAAVRILEDDPAFNAGRGSCLTRAGTVEMDAAIMDGDGLRAGAVAAVNRVRHPIALARAVLDDGEHLLLAGAGALAFARERGIALVGPSYHVTRAARAALARELARRRRNPPGPTSQGGGTVGAVARDRHGRVAAATSTGGMVGKRPGRIGDSPLPGAGTYADQLAGAASATGHGERIIQVALTKVAIDQLRAGVAPMAAARRAILLLDARVAGRGGVILVGHRGGPGVAFNTRSMRWASCDAGGVRTTEKPARPGARHQNSD
jgi:beta-aspartyl-peptidase (threonine type)